MGRQKTRDSGTGRDGIGMGFNTIFLGHPVSKISRNFIKKPFFKEKISKTTLLGVILHEKSIAHTAEALKRFPDPDSGRISKRKLEKIDFLQKCRSISLFYRKTMFRGKFRRTRRKTNYR